VKETKVILFLLCGFLGTFIALLGLVLSVVAGAHVRRFLIAGSIAVCGNMIGIIIAGLRIDLASDPQAAVGALMAMIMVSVGTVLLYSVSLVLVFQFSKEQKRTGKPGRH
jgi:hypothetical protein